MVTSFLRGGSGFCENWPSLLPVWAQIRAASEALGPALCEGGDLGALGGGISWPSRGAVEAQAPAWAGAVPS